MPDKETADICSICLEDLINKIMITSCNHRFHEKCIKNYVKHNNDIERNSLCPICKGDVLKKFVLLSKKQRVIRCLHKYRSILMCLFVQTFIVIIIIMYFFVLN